MATLSQRIAAPVRKCFLTGEACIPQACSLTVAGTVRLYAIASHAGLLGVVSVLSSLYPLVTVVLALLIVKERVNGLQRSGIVVALAAVGCLAS